MKMNKEYLEALEIECGELVEMDLLFLDRNGENQEKWHDSEAFKKAVDFEKKYGKSAIHILKQALQRLEAIDNANPSEALEKLEKIKNYAKSDLDSIPQYFYDLCVKKNKEIDNIVEVIKQTLFKSQGQEKEIDRLENQCLDVLADNIRLKNKSQEQEKVLNAIFKKKFNVELFRNVLISVGGRFEYKEYEKVYAKYGKEKLTQEEFDLLKEYANEITRVKD